MRAWLASREGPWREALRADKAVRVAVNQEMAGDATTVKPGDEVAFFPPVTGG
jgi:molybdopterin synthase sulfur carrier subunit